MIIKLDKRGTFTIPKIIRETLGLKPDAEIKLELDGEKLIITKPKNK
jgi:AbrB family looped-hinge helix DNA binding protein